MEIFIYEGNELAIIKKDDDIWFRAKSVAIIPRDAPVGHRRGNNPVEYVIFFFVTRSHKKQCRILIEV